MERKSRLNYQSCFRKTRLFSAPINFLFFNAYFFCSFCDIITCNVPESGLSVFFHKECLSSGWRVAILVRFGVAHTKHTTGDQVAIYASLLMLVVVN